MTPIPPLSTAVADLDLPPLPKPSWARDMHGETEVYTADEVREAQRVAVVAALARSAAPAPAAEPAATIRHDGTGWDAVMTEHGYRLCGAGLLDGAALYAAPASDIAAAPEQQQEAARLNLLARYGAALRIDPEDGRWFLDAVHHTKIPCVDDHTRFDTPRAAIDAAISALKKGQK